MTPCEERGWKVGDQFRVIEASAGFRRGQVVELFRDEGTGCPLFAGKNKVLKHAGGNPGAYLGMMEVEKLTGPRWTPWDGHRGEHSCRPDAPCVEVLFRNGLVSRGAAYKFGWAHGDGGTDIMGYRIVNQEEKPDSEWDGEGLPPVGCECEYIGNDTSWGAVRVIGYDGDAVVFRPSGKQYYSAVPSHRDEFRPIRTHEQMAVEAMESAYRRGDKKGGKPQSMKEVYAAIRDGKIPGVWLDAGDAHLPAPRDALRAMLRLHELSDSPEGDVTIMARAALAKACGEQLTATASQDPTREDCCTAS